MTSTDPPQIPEEPVVYDATMVEHYTDYRRYIAEALDAMGSSRASIADVTGMSRSMVSHVLNLHRRLNPTLVGPLSRYFELDSTGRNLLSAMVDLDNESLRARRSAWATLQAHQRFLGAARPDEATLKVLSSWWICAIYELAAMKTFRADPAWIASVMVPPITEDQATEGLQSLIDAKMLVEDDEGSLRPADELQWTDSVLGAGTASDAARELHRGIFELGVTAMDRFEVADRHESASIMAVSAQRFTEVVTRLRELEREVFHLATMPSEHAPDRVVTLGIQLFPITRGSTEPSGSGGDAG